jgi:superfamily II DNA or RNA helicase
MRPLWAHQVRAIEGVRESLRLGFLRPIVVMPTGAGKTFTAGHMCHTHVAQGGTVLWGTHREELLDQAYDELTGFGLNVGVIRAGANGNRVNPHRPVQVASIQTLVARQYFPPASLVIGDECVAPGARIGTRRADSVMVGDLVPTWNGSHLVYQRVTHVFKNPAVTLRSIHVGNAVTSVTDTHPIWIQGKGYVEAARVSIGDMCRVRRTYSTANKITEDMQRCMHQQALVRYDGDYKHNTCQFSDETKESDAQCRDSDQNESNASGYWSPPDCARRQRYWDDFISGETADRAWSGMDSRTCDPVGKKPTLSDMLQVGPSTSKAEDRCRGGWWESRVAPEPGERFEEDWETQLARVDHIEVHERGSDGTFGGRCPEGIVYNFEVEGDHNFFSDGILTHNCHHLVADKWFDFPKAYLKSIFLGLTATPARGDGKALDWFNRLIVPTSVQELTDLGVLVPCEYIRPSRALGPGKIAQRPVDAWLAHTPGQKTICFAPHTKAAEEYLEQFKAAGVSAAFVHHQSPDRAEILRKFKNNEIMVLINIAILTEGFDDREVTCCILARGCGSLSLYLQIIGRILRSCPGKTSCTLLDLNGQSHIHGKVTDEREYSLTGEGCRRKGDPVKERFCAVCGVLIEQDSFVCLECGIQRPELVCPEVTNDKLDKFAWIKKQTPEYKKQHWLKMLAEAAAAGKKPGSAYYRFRGAYGEDPPTR